MGSGIRRSSWLLRTWYAHLAREPAKPPPAALPDVGFRQFADADAIQIGIVYIRDIAGRNYPVLGVIDECTHLHQAAVLGSRLPGEALRKFVRIWAQPLGYPLISILMEVFEANLKSTWTPRAPKPISAHLKLTTELA